MISVDTPPLTECLCGVWWQASLRDLKKEISAQIDVPQKQNAMKAVGKGDVQVRTSEYVSSEV